MSGGASVCVSRVIAVTKKNTLCESALTFCIYTIAEIMYLVKVELLLNTRFENLLGCDSDEI